MMGGGQAGGGGLDALVAVAESLKDPNFAAKVQELKDREAAAQAAETSAQARIDAATAANTDLDARLNAVASRESAANDKDALQAQTGASLNARDTDLTTREQALKDGVVALEKRADQLTMEINDKEAASALRTANAQAALDKRAADLAAREDAIGAREAAADAAKAAADATLARLQAAMSA
jgi:chromosome segregation ATPase